MPNRELIDMLTGSSPVKQGLLRLLTPDEKRAHMGHTLDNEYDPDSPDYGKPPPLEDPSLDPGMAASGDPSRGTRQGTPLEEAIRWWREQMLREGWGYPEAQPSDTGWGLWNGWREQAGLPPDPRTPEHLLAAPDTNPNMNAEGMPSSRPWGSDPGDLPAAGLIRARRPSEEGWHPETRDLQVGGGWRPEEGWHSARDTVMGAPDYLPDTNPNMNASRVPEENVPYPHIPQWWADVLPGDWANQPLESPNGWRGLMDVRDVERALQGAAKSPLYPTPDGPNLNASPISRGLAALLTGDAGWEQDYGYGPVTPPIKEVDLNDPSTWTPGIPPENPQASGIYNMSPVYKHAKNWKGVDKGLQKARQDGIDRRLRELDDEGLLDILRDSWQRPEIREGAWRVGKERGLFHFEGITTDAIMQALENQGYTPAQGWMQQLNELNPVHWLENALNSGAQPDPRVTYGSGGAGTGGLASLLPYLLAGGV